MDSSPGPGMFPTCVRPSICRSTMWSSPYMSRVDGGLWPAAIYECPFWPVRSVERYRGPFNRTLANKILIANNLVCSGPRRGRFVYIGQDADLLLVRSFHALRERTTTCGFAGSERNLGEAERFWGESCVYGLRSNRRDHGQVFNNDLLTSIPRSQPLRPVLMP